MTPRTRKLALAGAILLVLIAGGSLLLQRIPAYASAPLFVLVIVIEVVIAPIPGGVIGYMGAARFGFLEAWPLLYAGNVIGTTLVFFLSRKLGAPLFEESVSPKTRRRYDAVLAGHPLLLWAVYTIPAVPVDVLSILAGLSRIPARRFLLIAWTGFVVYTGIVAYVGSSLGRYVGVARMMSILGIVLVLALGWWLWRSHRQRRGAAASTEGS